MNSNNQACLVSQHFVAVHSVQTKNVFLLYISTRITHTNTLLNNSDDPHLDSQTCFHFQCYCVLFVCSTCDALCKMKEITNRMQILAYLPAYFTTNSINFKNNTFSYLS